MKSIGFDPSDFMDLMWFSPKSPPPNHLLHEVASMTLDIFDRLHGLIFMADPIEVIALSRLPWWYELLNHYPYFSQLGLPSTLDYRVFSTATPGCDPFLICFLFGSLNFWREDSNHSYEYDCHIVTQYGTTDTKLNENDMNSVLKNFLTHLDIWGASTLPQG